MIRPKLGVLVPYVRFYENIVPLADEKRQFAESVVGLLSREFEVTGGLIETEAETAAMGAEFVGAKVDGVLVIPAVAAFGALAWAALSASSWPVCIWSVQPDGRVPEDYDIRKLIRNSGGLATQALANTLVRHGRKFCVAWSSGVQEVPQRVREWALAAALANRLKSIHLGCVGSVFEQMTDVAFDSAAWEGVPVRSISTDEFADRYLAQTESRVDACVAEIRRRHAIDGLSDDALVRSARLSLALDEVVEIHMLDGGTFNCHGANCLQDERMGVAACYAVSRQTSEGRAFSCTGDIPTTIALWMLSQLADTVIYGELDMVDPERDFVLLANGGEGHFAAAQSGVTLTGNENFEGVHGRGAALQFDPFEGPATILSFTPIESGGYRCIAAAGTLMPVHLPGLRVFHAAFRFDGIGARAGFEAWCEAGAIHHLALAPGHWTGPLSQMAAIRGFEWREIGAQI